MESLVQLLTDGSNAAAQRRALCTLAGLCTTDREDLKRRAADAGAVEALARLIGSSQVPGVLHVAACALANICSGSDAGIKQRAAGAVEPLGRLISSSQDPGVLTNAAGALASICAGNDAGIKQQAAGAVEPLVQLIIRSSQDPDVRGDAVRAMWSICSSSRSSIQQAAAAAGVVEALVQLATSQQPGGSMTGGTAAGGSSPALQRPVCARCGRSGCRHKRLRLCGACRAVRYCGERCQRLHWPEHCRTCAGAAQQQGTPSSG